MDERLVRLQNDLRKIQGVSSVRIVGEDEPAEIHVVATRARPPKQLVRDVQSLAAARFDIAIDHRIVSVVQLDEGPAPAPEERRPALERVVLASKSDGGWVKVALQWPDGAITEGAGTAGATRETRARGATTALAGALAGALTERGARLEVDHLTIDRVGPDETVIVRAMLWRRGSGSLLLGCAVISDDVATAAVRALLQAVNRKLSSA
jgi:hypothetical protein